MHHPNSDKKRLNYIWNTRLCLHGHMMILEGIPPHLAKHDIDLYLGTIISIKQQRNQKYEFCNYSKENIKQTSCSSYHIAHQCCIWFSPMEIIPKKTRALRIYVNFWKLNANTKKNHCPIPYMEEIIKKWQTITYSCSMTTIVVITKWTWHTKIRKKNKFSYQWGPTWIQVTVPWSNEDAYDLQEANGIKKIFEPFIEYYYFFIFFNIYGWRFKTWQVGETHRPTQNNPTNFLSTWREPKRSFLPCFILCFIEFQVDILPNLNFFSNKLQIQPPKAHKEVQRLLGLTQFSCMFIRNLA
jgi:hypothetical protein